ncbi:NAD(P)-dependent oxidoreductase [Sulfitobacter sp. AS92]|uniref:NAD(P)-dependent oxidoreductase n=1 Tax=Sulfitobacter sp. AS92 TaxID=3135783 RepID=UPI003174E9EA
MTKYIGFVGLGKMGLPMAANLTRKGNHRVLAYDSSAVPFEALSKHEAWGDNLYKADSLAELERCTYVIVMLPNSMATNRVVKGDKISDGLIDILQPGTTIIDMGSSNPSETLQLGRLLAPRGIQLIDAPVSGSVAKAVLGQLTIMVGCDKNRLESLRPVLGQMGTNLVSTGGIASAHTMKALNNYVYAAGLLATSEAVNIAENLGLDLSVFAYILNNSSGRNVATETKLEQFIISGKYSGGFSLQLQAKDLRTAASLQELSNFHAAQLSACADLWDQAAQSLTTDADNTEIHKYLRLISEADIEKEAAR